MVGTKWQGTMLAIPSRLRARIFPGGGSPLLSGSHFALPAIGPAAIGERTSFDPVFLVCGFAVLSAGLVVLHAAHSLPRQAFATVTAVAPATHRYTAEEALAERARLRGDTSVLVDALAEAAATFYAIAGELPREASERAVQRADDLRELVWQNRSR